MNKKDQSKLASAVRRGAKLLDKASPGWARKVRLGTLSIASCESCVLGQLYGDFTRGVVELDLNPDSVAAEPSHPGYLGFDLHPTVDTGEGYDEFNTLTDAWKDEVRARRAGRSN